MYSSSDRWSDYDQEYCTPVGLGPIDPGSGVGVGLNGGHTITNLTSIQPNGEQISGTTTLMCLDGGQDASEYRW